jgi:phage-related protein
LEQAVASHETGNIDFSVYPNPNDGNFTVKITGNTQVYTVEIFNASGGLLGKINCNAESVTINRSDLFPGIYYLKLTAGSESRVKKLIVNH